MKSPQIDRRTLVKIGGGLAASLLAGRSLSTIAREAAVQRDAQQFTTLTPKLAATLEAMAARILPTTDTPGAREAGAVWFMDTALRRDLPEAQALLEQGAAALDSDAGGSFTAKTDEEQDRLLQKIEDGDFFGLVHFLTLAGTFTLPAYGGNRKNVGWELLGLSTQHHWSPPFGYYDRGHHGEAES